MVWRQVDDPEAERVLYAADQVRSEGTRSHDSESRPGGDAHEDISGTEISGGLLVARKAETLGEAP